MTVRDTRSYPAVMPTPMGVVAEGQVATERSDDESLWTEKRLAAHWDVSVRTIQRMRATGEGPAYIKIGKQVRYRPRIVRQYEQDNARRSTSDEGR